MEEWDLLGKDVTVRLLDGGHWIYRERAEEVNEILDGLLKQLGGENGEFNGGK